MGQSKLNEALIEKMKKEALDGLPTQYICDLSGVHQTTFYAWMNQGEKDFQAGENTLQAKLWTTIKKSYATYVKSAKEEMKSREKGWQSIAWWLERTNPFFMPKQQIQADDDGKVTVVIGGKEKNVKKA